LNSALPNEVHDAVVALRLTQAAFRQAHADAEAADLGGDIQGLEAEEARERQGQGGNPTPEDCDAIEARLKGLEHRYYQKLSQHNDPYTDQHREAELENLRWRIENAERQLNRLRGISGGGSRRAIDIDAHIVPYPGAVQEFGTSGAAHELTSDSVYQSDQMVDSIERAQAMEGKRAVYRALTHLRGAAINSYDGIAHGHMRNVDAYAKSHTWRQDHPVRHLAEEEADTHVWAYPVDYPEPQQHIWHDGTPQRRAAADPPPQQEEVEPMPPAPAPMQL